MISKSTVFIIGAGASADYGIPVGSKLVESLLRQLAERDGTLSNGLRLAGIDNNDIVEFRRRLEGSQSESIDGFLEENGERVLHIGKYAITFAILEGESRCKTDGRLSEKPPKDHWLRYVWNKLFAGCSARTLSSNKVAFVTFNYDRVLETYLDAVIQNKFGLSPSEATSVRSGAFPIIHLHGRVSAAAFGDFRDELVAGELSKLASGIRVVSEAAPDTESAFEAAHQHIARAAIVCFLGFGYHPVNVRRLKTKESAPSSATIMGSTYDMGQAEINGALDLLGRPVTWGVSSQKCEAFLRHFVPLG